MEVGQLFWPWSSRGGSSACPICQGWAAPHLLVATTRGGSLPWYSQTLHQANQVEGRHRLRRSGSYLNEMRCSANSAGGALRGLRQNHGLMKRSLGSRCNAAIHSLRHSADAAEEGDQSRWKTFASAIRWRNSCSQCAPASNCSSV